MKAILTYHSIDASGSPISVDVPTFERHVAWLTSGAVHVVPLAEIGDAPDGAIALTFDDAFADFAGEAWPRLRDAGLPVTLFVVTGRVGGDNSWGGAPQRGIPVLPLLGWDQLAGLAEEGVDVGAHSRTHVSLPRVDSDRLGEELEGSGDDIEAHCGRRPGAFAYPYGDFDRRCVEAAGRCFDVCVTTELTWLRPGDDPRALPRLDAWYLRAPGAIESFGSGGFANRIRIRRAARALRRLVAR